MSEALVRPGRPATCDEPVTEELLLSDLLGFAGYLTNAVAADAVQIDLARAELVEAAATSSERRALHGAARRAADQLGVESPLASLLRSAVDEQTAPATTA